MAKKTVIRALVKRLPMSSEDMRRLMIEDEDNSLRDVSPANHPTGPNLAQRLQERIAKPPEALDPEPEPETPANRFADLDVSSAAPGSVAWDRGVADFESEKSENDCPYELDGDVIDWVGAFRSAKFNAENAGGVE